MLEGIAPILVLFIGAAGGMGVCFVTMICFYLSCCGRIFCGMCGCVKKCIDVDRTTSV